ncbi:hypothetical protein Tco_0069580, partial [Tanacetum coccineum]
VMAISVISVSSDSSEDSMGTPAGRVIFFGSDPYEDPSSDHIPPLPSTSPFLSSTNDTTDSDTPDTPPSPTHDSSSDFHSDASSDSSLRHSLSDHYSLNLPSTSARPSRKRRRSPMTSAPALSPVFGALSHVRAELIPSPKRVRDSGYLEDIEVDPIETSLRMMLLSGLVTSLI